MLENVCFVKWKRGSTISQSSWENCAFCNISNMLIKLFNAYFSEHQCHQNDNHGLQVKYQWQKTDSGCNSWLVHCEPSLVSCLWIFSHYSMLALYLHLKRLLTRIWISHILFHETRKSYKSSALWTWNSFGIIFWLMFSVLLQFIMITWNTWEHDL